jgi:hypothetical protein
VIWVTFERRLAASERLAELGQPFLRWVVTFHRSNRARMAGQLGTAEPLAHEALEIGTGFGNVERRATALLH